MARTFAWTAVTILPMTRLADEKKLALYTTTVSKEPIPKPPLSVKGVTLDSQPSVR